MTVRCPQDEDHFGKEAVSGTKRTKTLARILDAAAALIAMKGSESTSVVEIAQKAGIGNGTIYSYFSNKDEIVETVYTAITHALVSDILGSIDKLEDGADQIALGTIWFVEAIAAEPHQAALISRGLDNGGEFYRICADAITRYIGNGVRQKQFTLAHDLRPESGFLDVYISVLSGAIRSYQARSAADLHELSRLAAEVHLGMLGIAFADSRGIARRVQDSFGAPPVMRMPSIAPNPARR